MVGLSIVQRRPGVLLLEGRHVEGPHGLLLLWLIDLGLVRLLPDVRQLYLTRALLALDGLVVLRVGQSRECVILVEVALSNRVNFLLVLFVLVALDGLREVVRGVGLLQLCVSHL